MFTLNLDRRISLALEVRKHILSRNPFVICIQDLPTQENPSKHGEFWHHLLPDYEITLALKTREADDSLPSELANVESSCKIDSAILTHRSLVKVMMKHTREEKTKPSVVGLSVIINQKKYIIFSIYVRPQTSHHELGNVFGWIESKARQHEGLSRMILMGDFNAENHLWVPDGVERDVNKVNANYNKLKRIRGGTIANTMFKWKMTVVNSINKPKTYTSSLNNNAFIDLVIVGSKVHREWRKLETIELVKTNGHDVLYLKSVKQQSLDYSTHSVKSSTKVDGFKPNNKTYKIINAHDIKPEHFLTASARTNNLLLNWNPLTRERAIERLDHLAKVLCEEVKNVQEQITKIKQRRIRTRKIFSGIYWKRIRKIKRAEVRLVNVSKTRNARNKLERSLNQQNTKLIDFFFKETLKDRSKGLPLWEKVKLVARRRNLYSKASSKSCNTFDNSNEIYTQQAIESIVKEKFPKVKRKQDNWIEKLLKQNPQCVKPCMISREEIDVAIYGLRKKKFTSPEGIKMQVFFKAIKYVSELIYVIIQKSFELHHIPNQARTTKGIIIPKKEAGKYRVVHLSNPIAALMESIALRRFEYLLNTRNLISPYQFGFTAGRSRQEIIARILELATINRCVNQKRPRNIKTTIVSLDIQGAFDNVDQDYLITKLDEELGEDPIKHWIIEFILNRKIFIQYKNLKSSVRKINIGVPQGSALGPVLWNFAIHDIESGLVKPKTLEILKYADDLIIVHVGKDTYFAQITIENLVMKLNEMRLCFNAEKSKGLIIKPSSKKRSFDHRLHISGKEIEFVNELNILGIPLDNKLKLAKVNDTIKTGVSEAINILRELKRSELFNLAHEWRIILDSMIMGRLVAKYWPVLIQDNRTRRWLDKEIIRVIRQVFDWPDNSSAKLMRLITQLPSCSLLIEKYIKSKYTTSYSQMYINLERSCIPGCNLSLSDMRTLGEMVANENVYNNPERMFVKIIRVTDCHAIWDEFGPFWVLDGSHKFYSIMSELHGNQILQVVTGINTHFQTCYYNSMSLLLHMVDGSATRNKNVLMSEDESIYKAITNMLNRDWKVINLRSRLYENGWTIFTINDRKKILQLKKQSHHILGLISDKDRYTIKGIDTITLLDKNDGDQITTTATPVINFKLTVPDVRDCRARYKIMKKLNADMKREIENSHTCITRLLTEDVKTWFSMPPNWLDGVKMIMLSGLVNNLESSRLEKDRGFDQCDLCGKRLTVISLINGHVDNWNKAIGVDITANRLFHRAYNCEVTKATLTQQLKSLHNNGSRTVADILKNRRDAQRLLRLYAQSALYLVSKVNNVNEDVV